MRALSRPDLVGVLIVIVVVCGDHKSHLLGAHCSRQTGALESTLGLGNVAEWPVPIEVDAGFESDVNGQEKTSEQTRETGPSLIDQAQFGARSQVRDNHDDDDDDDGNELSRRLTNKDDSLETFGRDLAYDQNEVQLDSDNDYDKRDAFHQDLQEVESSWCNVDAELDGHCRRLLAHNYSQALRVCGSDGKFYETICDFRRRSCIRTDDNHHQHLLRMESISYCLSYESSKNHCSRREFEQFKAALFSEYNQDVGSMFKHLDTNNNQLIEARELWPRTSQEDEQFAKTRNCDDCYPSTHYKGPFEPHFDWSPCSLSHLLVYENRTSFSQDQFIEMFAKLLTNLRILPETNGNNVKISESFIETMRSKIVLGLGESKLTECLPEGWRPSWAQTESTCSWTRYGVDLGTIKDEHVVLTRGESIGDRQGGGPPKMYLKDVQLYLSGPYKCTCSYSGSNTPQRTVQHQVDVQVLAQPRVSVRPKFQWSLPESRIAFECQHDFIDTNFNSANNVGAGLGPESGEDKIGVPPPAESAYRLRWSRDDHRQWIVDSKDYNDELNNNNNNKRAATLAPSSSHASVAAAAGRLVLERAQVNDTGRYYCLVEQFDSFNVQTMKTTTTSVNDSAKIISSNSNFGQLLIQDETQSEQLASAVNRVSDAIKYLWSFHENGISIYKLRTDDGQELELVRELAGQSQVDAEVDGNWNQLTLCGGFNPDQVVACEWSDNALVVEVPNVQWLNRFDDTDETTARERDPNRLRQPDKYIYAGQPNLNRVIVVDAVAHKLVAIINTEPQPRKLFSFKPNKIHLSKWVRRRLSPLANARWLKAIDEQQTAQQQQSRAHPLKLTPKSSRLYSDKRRTEENGVRSRRHSQTTGQLLERRSITPPKLVQHDIWLLCYGRPLVVDSARDSNNQLADGQLKIHGLGQREPTLPSSTSWWSTSSSLLHKENALDVDDRQNSSPPFTPLVATWPLIGTHWAPPLSRDSSGPASTPSSHSANKEARLRNRKSVQIIQSTFFPALSDPAMHHHNKQQIDSNPSNSPAASRVVAKFKRLTVLTTHHVIANRGMSSISQDETPYSGQKIANRRMRLPQLDLVQSLTVPQVPYSQEMNPKFKLHYAYVTHYDERQLYRIAMDSYRYDMEIDLRNCDPLNLVSASQGLIIVQCRSPITHKLIGQLVLDELSSQIVQFKDNIRAQESCLTPDNRYLISIHTNQSSTIYVQSVQVGGLSLLYEIKTTLETTRCSFVWRDGYYSAIFVALNRRDKQSELLSLRLADSRLELIVRVPGLMTSSLRHKEPLNVEPELQIVTLSTDSGVHIIDLEENRIIQTIDHHHHQRTSPTLLWV